MNILRYVVPSFLLVFSACVSAESEQASGPASWIVADADTTIHLYGTMHEIPEEIDWLREDVARRFSESERLYVEVTAEQMEDQNIAPVIIRLGILPPGSKLSDHVSPETYRKLEEFASSQDAPMFNFNQLRPWLVALTVSDMASGRMTETPEPGAEEEFEARAARMGIPIIGLETVEDGMRGFADLSPEFQDKLLSETLDDLGNQAEDEDELTKAWLRGDVDFLYHRLVKDMEEYPEFAEALLYRRNRDWVGKIVALLDEPGTFFIAVGAGHMGGDKGLPAMLAQQGVEVTRNP